MRLFIVSFVLSFFTVTGVVGFYYLPHSIDYKLVKRGFSSEVPSLHQSRERGHSKGYLAQYYLRQASRGIANKERSPSASTADVKTLKKSKKKTSSKKSKNIAKN
jgi:hypothetical protein